MSGKLMGEVFSLALMGGTRDVLMALANHARDDGTGARPGLGRLGWEANLGRRQVIRILKKLEAMHIIIAVAYPNGGRGWSGKGMATEYEIHLEAAPKKPPYISDNDETPNVTVKGDIAMSPLPPSKGDISSSKGDISGRKGDIFAGNGDISSSNGDIQMSPQPSLQPSYTTLVQPSVQPSAPRGGASDFQSETTIETFPRKIDRQPLRPICRDCQVTIEDDGRGHRRDCRAYGRGAQVARCPKCDEDVDRLEPERWHPRWCVLRKSGRAHPDQWTEPLPGPVRLSA